MTSHDVDAPLARLDSALARAEGRRDALTARVAGLTQEVELAKGRLALKSEIEALIEDVHNTTNRRNLAAFETLLSALVQEVLPGEKPVSLQLSTERGLASLDICVVRPDGTLEDVLEDNGGALTNVVGMALRLIRVLISANAASGPFRCVRSPPVEAEAVRVSVPYLCPRTGASSEGLPSAPPWSAASRPPPGPRHAWCRS